MSSVPHMPFYGNDFFGSARVRLMSAEEKVAYLTLLWFQWTDDGLPLDEADLSRLLGSKPSERVLECFPVVQNKRRNPTLEGHRKRSKTMSKVQRNKANMRWHKPIDPMPDLCPDPCRTDAQKMPSVSVSVSVAEAVSDSVGKPTGEPDVKVTPLGTVMGAIRTHGYHNRKPPKKGDDARDVTIAKHLLETHPLDVVLQAIEGARALVDSGQLGDLGGGPFTLRLLNATWGGKAVFPQALDAYWRSRPRTEHPTEKRGGVSGIADLLKVS